MPSTIISHDEIRGELFAGEQFAGDEVTIEIQHDPCCPGEVCFGALHESQHMQVASVYLTQEVAVQAAVALLAAAAHIQRPVGSDFGENDGSEESWRASHERAAAWVRENVLR